MLHWALEPTVFRRLEKAMENPPSFETVGDISAGPDSQAATSKIVGTSAVIGIRGILTKAPNWIAQWLYGANTTYAGIIAAVNDAENDPRVEEIVFDVESPGGEITGLFDAMNAIASATKPTVARVEDLAASAAYGLASQADQITVNNTGAAVGSVGVVYSTFVSEGEIDITSSEAPNKRPDLTTEEGRAVIRAQLDVIHEEFAGRISEGRGVTLREVNANFGRGGMVLAKEALGANMIDGLDPSVNGEPGATAAEVVNMEVTAMTLKELQADHPDLFAEVQKTAVDGERSRVVAHLTTGAAAGAPEFAVECIKDGSPMASDTVQAGYMSARLAQTDVVESEEDDTAALDTPEAPEAETSQADFLGMVKGQSRVDMTEAK